MARVLRGDEPTDGKDGWAWTWDAEAKMSVLVPVVDRRRPINAQTGTTYTIAATDEGAIVTLDNADPITLTVPAYADAAFEVGAYVDLVQLGDGQVTVAAGSGATLRVSGLTAKALQQYSRLRVQKIGYDTWLVYGDVAAP